MNTIQKKILRNFITMIVILALILMGLMVYALKSLSDGIIVDIIQPMTKLAAQSVEGNLHMLADRIFMIKDNDILMAVDSTVEQRKSVLDKAESGIEFLWLGLFDTNGNFYAGDSDSPTSIGQGTFFELMNETQNLVIDDVSSQNGELSLTLGVPLTWNGEIQGYLAGSYRYDVLNDVLSNINVGQNGSAFIINSEGQILGHKNKELVMNKENISSYLGEGQEGAELLERIVAGETGGVVYGSGREAQYAGFSPIRGTNWNILVLVPRSDFMEHSNSFILIGVFVAVLLLLISMGIVIQFSSKIQVSLKNVTDRIRLLSEGDLKTKTEIMQTNDETQTLSIALGDMIKSINQYISELSTVLERLSNKDFTVGVQGEFRGDFVVMKESLDRITDSLNEVMNSIRGSAVEVSNSAKEVSENADRVHSSSVDQAASLGVLSDEASAISGHIKRVMENTEQTRNLMNSAKDSLETGDQHIRDLLNAMDEISRDAEEITKINKFLEDIAFQTNILALNASVEAARAGEAGKGFAVVATEVKNLAEKSAESSKKTSQMIEKSQTAVGKGAQYVQEVVSSFESIGQVSNEISAITEELADSVEIQKGSLENIASQIERLSGLAEENLSASQNSAVASQNLAQRAVELEDLSKKFKLRGEADWQ